MSVRSYFRTLFSRKAWRALLFILRGLPLTSMQIRRRYFGTDERGRKLD